VLDARLKRFHLLSTEDGKPREIYAEAKHIVAFKEELCTGFYFHVRRKKAEEDLAVILSYARDTGPRYWGIRAIDPNDDRSPKFSPPLVTETKDAKGNPYQQIIVGVAANLLYTDAKYIMYFCYDRAQFPYGALRTIKNLRMAYQDFDFDKDGRPVLESVTKALNAKLKSDLAQ
jgi:hypothetical protein